ncbi:hypothetical protein KSX_26900 [Ktedonospora formicarum]|uniref:Uncharacterized protein n=1 Tax=Ktedonospora formicarum TaxID=2778364 RepID=A0A8J3I1I2_9CHLR|nr:hypothetical protein KSX_26900 [Ktedonospora formicarum]
MMNPRTARQIAERKSESQDSKNFNLAVYLVLEASKIASQSRSRVTRADRIGSTLKTE